MIDRLVQLVAGFVGIVVCALVLYVWFEWNVYTMDMSYWDAIAPPFLNFDILLNFLEYLIDKWLG